MQRTLSFSSRLLTGLTLACALGLPGLVRADSTEFNDFGGKEGLTHIVDDFVNIVVADPRIGHYFQSTNLTRLRAQLTDQFCQLTGGPCEYGGANMKAVHQHLGLRNADFNALAEDLQMAMEKAGVPNAAQNKLLAKLAPMQHDIVTK